MGVPTGFILPPGIDSGAKVFVGYLMLDNLISNCDRHDQNFEIQVLPDGTQELAPTFDQGQAMGATLSDKQRQTFTTTDYQEYLEGSFYEGTDNILTPKAFEIAASQYPEAAAIWQERLARITPEQINEIFDRLPTNRITPVAAKFAKQVINDGREQILSLQLSTKSTLSQKPKSLADLTEPLEPLTELDIRLRKLNDLERLTNQIPNNEPPKSLTELNIELKQLNEAERNRMINDEDNDELSNGDDLAL